MTTNQLHQTWLAGRQLDEQQQGQLGYEPVLAPASSHPTPTPLTSFAPNGPPLQSPHPVFSKDKDHGWIFGHHPSASSSFADELRAMLLPRRNRAFAYSMQELPGYNGTALDGDRYMRLPLKPGGEDKLFQKPRRHSPLEDNIIQEKCVELRDADIIGRSPPGRAAVAHNTTLPAKKAPDGTWSDKRFCVDYRPVNAQSLLDKYSLHLPEELFQKVGRARFFSKIDLRGAFHQVFIHPEDQHRTSFWWGNELWFYKRVPYGLVNSPATLQRIMDYELEQHGLTDFAICFVDDLLVYSDTEQEHIQHVARVLDMLAEKGLRAHPDKSLFGTDAVEYLGFLIGHGYLHPHEAKVQAIRALRSPTNVSELRAVVGLCNYYRVFLPDFSVMAKNLHALTQKDARWEWTMQHEEEFQHLKNLLCEENRMLRRYDRNAPTLVYTDWSNKGIGAVLSQLDKDGNEYMVACLSRSLNPHEANYHAYEGELLAAVWGIRSFRHYLHGIEFMLVTDHQPLKWLLTTDELSGKYARWVLLLQEFSFAVEHRPGKENVVADLLSRQPMRCTYDPTGAMFDVTGADGAEVRALEQRMTALRLTSQPFKRLKPTVPKPPVVNPVALFLSQQQALELPPVASFMDYYAPVRQLAPALLPWMDADLEEDMQQLLVDRSDTPPEWLRRATRAVGDAVRPLKAARLSTPLPLQATWMPDLISTTVQSICTQAVPPDYYQAALRNGVVLVELFGGLAAGLHMVLTMGITVTKYVYCDLDPVAQEVAQHHMSVMQQQHPELLSSPATQASFCSLPQDVRSITAAQLEQLTSASPDAPWLVVAGWPCQDLSPAGKGKGLHGARSSAFFDTVKVLAWLQRNLQQPLAYVLENTYMQTEKNPATIRIEDFQLINSVIGKPVVMDAARFGSRAHRLRNFWTNLQPQELLQIALDAWRREPGILVQDVLEPNRQLLPTVPGGRWQPPPFYPCNRGAEVETLPTLVSYPRSRAYRDKRPGVLYDSVLQQYVEPSSDEREQLLGYPKGTTAAPGLTEQQRFQVTGQCMDANTLCALLSTCLALNTAVPSIRPYQPYPTPPLPLLSPEQQSKWLLPPLRTPELDKWYSPAVLKLAASKHWFEPSRTYPLRTWANPRQQLFEPLSTDIPPGHEKAGLGYNPVSEDAVTVSPAFAATLATSITQGGEDGLQPQTPIALPFTPAAPMPTIISTVHDPVAESLLPVAPAHAAAEAEAPPPEPLPTMLDVVKHWDQLDAEESNCAVTPAAEATSAAGVPAAVTPDGPTTTAHPDIWYDTHTTTYLFTGKHHDNVKCNAKESKRVWKRCLTFRVLDNLLQRKMPDQTWRVVPHPDQRVQLVQVAHSKTGHFGETRTLHALSHKFWWYGMQAMVKAVLKTCEVCGKINASFNHTPAVLQPLPIEGLFYRWHVDLLGPLPVSQAGNRYVMVMVEAFSKHIEVDVAPAKTSEFTSRAFLCNVLSRFGAPAEVVTDQGSEFQDQFHELLASNYIDHRTTSANHPAANGQAERVVQTIKRALEKHTSSAGTTADWDKHLFWVVLGYRTSKQKALGFSPYQLLYGATPTVPPAVRQQMEPPVELQDAEQAAEHYLVRAELLKKHCAMAAENLRIAQHRDTLRYNQVRSGFYRLTTAKFEPGDFVYVQKSTADTNLHIIPNRLIYKVLEVRDSGVMVVQGRCGTTHEVHLSHCAPCHLVNINPVIDPTLAEVREDAPCILCGSADHGDTMLICDYCNRGYHLGCMGLDALPAADLWCCDTCQQMGFTPALVEALQMQLATAPGRAATDVEPFNLTLKLEEEAHKLNGRRVLVKLAKQGKHTATPQGVLRWLPVAERKHKRRPLMLVVDGHDVQAISVSKAQGALRNALVVDVTPAGAQLLPKGFAAVAFMAATTRQPASGEINPSLQDAYDLRSAAGIAALYQDALGASAKPPPLLRRDDRIQKMGWLDPSWEGQWAEPFTHGQVELLLEAVNLGFCPRMADPAGTSVVLPGVLSTRFKKQLLKHKTHRSHPANWLRPVHYRRLQSSGLIDWVFLYPPSEVAELALAVAIPFARFGVALWVDRSFLSNLTTTRLTLLTLLKQQKRLALVQELEDDKLWLCVFTSATHRSLVLSADSARADVWISL